MVGNGARLNAARLTLVAGDADPYLAAATVEREQARLEQAGIPCETVSFPGEHELDPDVLARLAEE